MGGSRASGSHWREGWMVPKPVWTRWWRGNIPAPTGIRTTVVNLVAHVCIYIYMCAVVTFIAVIIEHQGQWAAENCSETHCNTTSSLYFVSESSVGMNSLFTSCFPAILFTWHSCQAYQQFYRETVHCTGNCVMIATEISTTFGLWKIYHNDCRENWILVSAVPF
jgi:hypothetical protein